MSKAWIPLMSERVLGDRLHADEATTTLALQHRMPIDFDKAYSYADMNPWTMGMIRTGAIYVLDYDHLLYAWDSIENVPIDLPPLPFPRIVIEAEKDGQPHTFMFDEDREGVTVLTDLILILEIAQGIMWDVALIVERKDKRFRDCFALRVTRCTNCGDLHFKTHKDTKAFRDPETGEFGYGIKGFAQYIISVVHMITAKNAPKEKLDLPRPQRRQFKRKYGLEHPQVYRVKLNQAGEQEGHAGWHYKVRFLVCGHWRHYPNGHRVWVKAYVKGPPGAPWKGRPVHESS